MSSNLKVKCYICSEPSTFWFTSNYHKLQDFDIYKCNHCKCAFVYPYPAQDYLKNFYDSNDNSMMDNLKNQTPQEIRAIIQSEKDNPNSILDAHRIIKNLNLIKSPQKNKLHFLDVGAGYGFFSNAALKAGYEVTALETNKNIGKVFNELNGFYPDSYYFNSDFSSQNKQKFSIVLLSQVLEHLALDNKPVENISECLEVGGIAVICVPHFKSLVSILQGKNDMFITPPEHLNFFTIRGLNKIFFNNGFELIKIQTVSRISKATLKRKFGYVGLFFYYPIKYLLNLIDILNCGMFINAYYKRKY